mgnify:CR=1 FL=1
MVVILVRRRVVHDFGKGITAKGKRDTAQNHNSSEFR